MYHIPYTQHHHLNHGNLPFQTKFDKHGSPLSYDTSQGVFSHGHPIPGCHGCCNYGYTAPVYNNQPYPYYPPPPPFYYHGAYPSFPPVYYPPPPHYPIDQPGYEFAKNQFTDNHCCRCFGDESNMQESQQVKTKQKEPDTENISTSSLVPVEPISQPYKQREQNPCDLRIKDNVKTTGPRIGNLKERESNKLPFPMFWAPASEEGKKYLKETDLSGTNMDNSVIELHEREGKVGSESGPEEMVKRNRIPKVIPVKQGGDNGEKRDKETVKEKGDGEKKLSEIVTKPKLPPVCLRVEPLRKKKNESSRSPSARTNKDELSSCAQNEKNEFQTTERERQPVEVVDGKARVQISKDIKENEERRDAEAYESEVANMLKKKDHEETNMLEKKEWKEVELVDAEAYESEVANMLKKKDHEETNMLEKKEWKEVELVDGKTREKKREDERLEGPKDMNKERMDLDAKSEATDKTYEETIVLEKMEKTETNMLEKMGKSKKKLSEVEAAVIIQSAYRGFEVRRWDPLKKLKQISEIREKLAEVRKWIEALEASSDSSGDFKQRMVIGETIMSLLLKLDAIQGLYPTVREIRKSVAKDLASIQEQLDSLGNRSSEFFTSELEDPKGGHDKSEIGHKNSVVFPQDDVPNVVQKEVCEKAKEDITPSNCVNVKDENMSYVMLTDEYHDDLNNNELMATKANSSEPNALTNEPSVFDGELSLEEDKPSEPIPKKMCENLQDGDYKSPSEEELQGLIDECEDEIKREINIESDDHHRVEQEKVSEEVHSEDILKPEDIKQYQTKHDLKLADENLELLENKYVLETENVANNKNMEPVETKNYEKQFENGCVELLNVENNKILEPEETKECEQIFEIASETGLGSDGKLVEENEGLREMVAKLVEAGKEQLSVISSLSCRVKDLEMKLGKKKKRRIRRIRV